jgi:hypothetical protein
MCSRAELKSGVDITHLPSVEVTGLEPATRQVETCVLYR